MLKKTIILLSMWLHFGVSLAQDYTHYSHENCIAIDGYVSSLDFSLEFPEVEELMFSLPTPSTPQRKKAHAYSHPQSDLGISKNVNVDTIFFTRNIRAASFLKFANMPNVRQFSFIVKDDDTVNWKEISKSFKNLEMITIDFTEGLLDYVNVPFVFQGLENVLSVKRLNLSLDDKSAIKVLTIETANLLGSFQQLEEIYIYISRLKFDVNDYNFTNTYQELLQKLTSTAKIHIKNIILYGDHSHIYP